MVKFAKDGSACPSAAVRLSRAHTGRDHIALCGDHPFFASNDWFIGTTEINAGIPRSIQNLSHTFKYNDPATLETLFQGLRGEIRA